jgi:hypothetical protein
MTDLRRTKGPAAAAGHPAYAGNTDDLTLPDIRTFDTATLLRIATYAGGYTLGLILKDEAADFRSRILRAVTPDIRRQAKASMALDDPHAPLERMRAIRRFLVAGQDAVGAARFDATMRSHGKRKGS